MSQLTCEHCGRRFPREGNIATVHVDVSEGFGEAKGKVLYAVNHCRDVRVCREGAERKADEFAAKWRVTA